VAREFRRGVAFGLALFRALARRKPHYLRDYNFVLAKLLARNDYGRAMHLSVGGDYDTTGAILASLLARLGLRDHQFVVDVGCGSGRLASALANRFDVHYHGTDILQPLLDYARTRAPSTYRFTRVERIAIPEKSDSADFVTFFSVATHLLHHETYLYLEEARRVAAPGGLIVVSFLEFGIPWHWSFFHNTVRQYHDQVPDPLNVFIERSVFPVWAEKLGLEIVAIHPGSDTWIPVARPEPVGTDVPEEGLSSLGQSCAVLRKPL